MSASERSSERRERCLKIHWVEGFFLTSLVPRWIPVYAGPGYRQVGAGSTLEFVYKKVEFDLGSTKLTTPERVVGPGELKLTPMRERWIRASCFRIQVSEDRDDPPYLFGKPRLPIHFAGS